MSMLADRRRKAHYVLQPKGKALYDDSNSFGTKMLEKMGWNKGEGLGKDAKGNIDFVRVTYKSGNKGFGFDEKDDQWTEHEKHFSNLLSSLQNSTNNSAENSNGEDNEEGVTKINCESLEEKSKKSKARVHYKKFTRGKDLSQYSEKDLANIFGKKNILEKFESSKDTESNIESNENSNTGVDGIQMVKSNLTIHDYFKQKKQMKMQNQSPSSETINQEDQIEGGKKKKRKHVGTEESVEGESIVTTSKAKDKERKLDQSETDNVDRDKEVIKEALNQNSEFLDDTEEIESQNLNKKKKKKKRSKEQSIRETLEIQSKSIEIMETPQQKTKKNKKNKNALEMNSNELITISDEVEIENDKNSKLEDQNKESDSINDGKSKKKKKKSKKDLDVNCNQDESETILGKEKLDKKSKKRKHEKNSVSEKDALNINNNSKDDYFLANTITINRYIAEKFRYTDLNAFSGSNMTELPGYGITQNFDVKIKSESKDLDKITNFWNSTTIDVIEKYELDTKFKNYKEKVMKARIENKKIPNFNVKHLKKKSCFGQIKI